MDSERKIRGQAGECLPGALIQTVVDAVVPVGLAFVARFLAAVLGGAEIILSGILTCLSPFTVLLLPLMSRMYLFLFRLMSRMTSILIIVVNVIPTFGAGETMSASSHHDK